MLCWVCRVSFLVLAQVSKTLQKHSLTCSSLSTHSHFKFVLPLLSLLSVVLLDCWLAPVEILLLHSLLISTFAACSHGQMLLYAHLFCLVHNDISWYLIICRESKIINRNLLGMPLFRYLQKEVPLGELVNPSMSWCPLTRLHPPLTEVKWS